MKSKDRGSLSFLIVAALLLAGCPDLNKNGDSPAVAGPTHTGIAFSGNKLEITFDKELKSFDASQITITLDDNAITEDKTNDYTLSIDGSKLVITLIKPPIAGVYTVTLKANAVKSADGGLSMAVKPDPTIKILNPPEKEQPRTEQPEEEPKPKESLSSNELSRQLIKEQPEVTPSPAYTKGSITQNNNKIELSFSKALVTMANVSPNPTHITVTRAGKALTNKTDYTLGIAGSKLVITLITPPIAGNYMVALKANAVKSADGVLSMAVSPDPTIEILSSNELSRQLIVAVYLNDAKEVATLIAAGADVNAKDEAGRTPLHLAAFNGHTATAQALIAAGADVKAKDIYGKPLLYWAVYHGYTAIVKALTAAGADVKAKDKHGKTTLFWAAREGHTDIVKILIDAGADVKVKDKDDKTLLHLAASKGHTATVQALIDAEADLNAKDRFGKTALFLAITNGHKATVQALIDAKADLNAKDRSGKTPLKLAKRLSFTAIVQLLEAAGAKE